MPATIVIDEEILRVASERARATGRTTNAVLSEVLRRGLGIAEPELEPLRDGCPQIRFDPAFEPSSESILELLQRVEQKNDLGLPLIVSSATLECIERIASKWNLPIGKAAVRHVEESLLLQNKWPTRDGEIEALRRPDSTPVITIEFVKYLQNEAELEDYLD
jgi:hypothetical protein